MWGLSLSTYVFSLPTYVIDNSAIKCLVNCDLFWISSTNHRELCQMPYIWHLRHQTLKTKYCVKCIKILRYITVTFHLSFFASLHLLCSRLYLLLSFSRTSTSPSFFLFFPPFFPFLSLSLCAFTFSISFFFPYYSPSLSFFFLRLGRCHWDRPSWVRPRRGVQPHQWGRCHGDILFWSPSVLFLFLLWLLAVIGYGGGGLCCVWCDFVEDFEFFFFFFLFCCGFCLEWKNRTWYFNV